MNPNESWLAEQARLLLQEEGFGPTPARTDGNATDDAEAASGRSSSG